MSMLPVQACHAAQLMTLCCWLAVSEHLMWPEFGGVASYLPDLAYDASCASSSMLFMLLTQQTA